MAQAIRTSWRKSKIPAWVSDPVKQGFSNCGMRTTSRTQASVQCYTGLVRKKSEVENIES
jgi:hypothetical protein